MSSVQNAAEKKKIEYAKKYLSKLPEQEKAVKRLRASAAELREMAEKAKRGFPHEPVQMSHNALVPDDMLAKAADIEARAEQEEKKRIRMSESMRPLIRAIETPIYCDILEMHYICGMSWDSVADSCLYSRRYVLKLHNKALIAFYDYHKAKENREQDAYEKPV